VLFLSLKMGIACRCSLIPSPEVMMQPSLKKKQRNTGQDNMSGKRGGAITAWEKVSNAKAIECDGLNEREYCKGLQRL